MDSSHGPQKKHKVINYQTNNVTNPAFNINIKHLIRSINYFPARITWCKSSLPTFPEEGDIIYRHSSSETVEEKKSTDERKKKGRSRDWIGQSAGDRKIKKQMSSSAAPRHGGEKASSFAVTCNLLSQYIKEKGRSLGDLGLGMAPIGRVFLKNFCVILWFSSISLIIRMF